MSERFYVIPKFEQYAISRSLQVKDLQTGSILMPIGSENPFVRLKSGNESIARLYVLTFIGDGPFAIIPGSRGQLFTYVSPSIKQVSHDEFMLTGMMFKRIPGFKRYIISENGIVFDLHLQKFMHHAFNHGDYAVTSLIDDTGFRYPRKIHRLIYRAFIGEIPNGMTVDHRDNKKWNNVSSNLQLLTAGENAIKAFREGKSIARWTDSEIEIMCKMLSNGCTNREIASAIGYDYDADRPTLNHILFAIRHGLVHMSIASKYKIDQYKGTVNRPDSKLQPNEVMQIRKELASGTRIIDIARRYDCTASTIAKIRDYKTWKHLPNSG